MQKFTSKIMQSTIPVVAAATDNKFPAMVPPPGQSIRVVGDSPASILEG